MFNRTFTAQEEEAWIIGERERVVSYLAKEGVDHLGVGEWPAFHVQPYVAVWAVQSRKRPGAVGWWAISGDLPADYMSSKDAKDPRAALAHFGHQWSELSGYMSKGITHPESRVGSEEEQRTLSALLKSRAELLSQFAADDSLWIGG